MRRRLAALIGAGILLGSCSTTNAPSALAQWASQSNLHHAVTVLRGDARHAASALRDPSSTDSQLHTVCAVLLVDTESANASLPTPDAQATNLLSRAYTKFGAGANECYRASTSVAARHRALTSLEAAVAALSEATARIAAASAV